MISNFEILNQNVTKKTKKFVNFKILNQNFEILKIKISKFQNIKISKFTNIEFLKGTIEKNTIAGRVQVARELERKLERDSRELNIFKEIVEDLKLLKL